MEDKGKKTLNAIDLFTDVDEYIIHIPHSSTLIPNTEGFTQDTQLVINEINLLTDWYTDKIFNVEHIETLVFPYSRLFCDVERLVDGEALESVGRGYYYTHTDGGQLLRTDNKVLKQRILELYYKPHHNKLSELVDSKLSTNGRTTIIDCHSFSDIPYKTDLDQDTDRPDICLGVDPFHTPQDLLDRVLNAYTQAGFSIKINSPYSGTILPLEYLNTNPNVQSIMIEVNKKLYVNDDLSPNNGMIQLLNSTFSTIF